MKCEKCGKRMKKGDEICPECGAKIKASDESIKVEKDAKKKSENKYKIIFITMISVILVAVIVFLAAVILPNTGNDFWTRTPEYSVEKTQLEAGVECDVLELIEITDEGKREWEVSVAEDNVDTSKLGTYTVEYLFTADKTERSAQVEYQVVEGDLPEIEQVISVVEYGEKLDYSDSFEVTNIKDFEYEIDDSNCTYNTLGIYPVYVSLLNSRGVDEVFEYEISIVDTELPNVECPEKIMLVKGEEVNLIEYAQAEDNYDGDITDTISFSGQVDADVPGTYKVTYSAKDSSGNKDEASVNVFVMASIGDAVDINNWTVTAEKGYFDNRIDDRGYQAYFYWYYDALDGKTFYVINLKTKNNGNEKDCLADEMIWDEEEVIYLWFGSETSFKQQTYELANDITNSNERDYVQAGKTKSGKLYFEVPETYKDFEGQIYLEIASEIGSDKGESIFILLKK